VNVEAKGRYQVQKRITQQQKLRVIFGLMPAFVFYQVLQKLNRVRNTKLKKVAHGVTVSISEQVSTGGPNFRICSFGPGQNLLGSAFPKPSRTKETTIFSHTEVIKNARNIRYAQARSCH
jgi:hypothetical protein